MNNLSEVTNFIRSLKPFVNKQGVAALDTLENVFDLMEDPKVKKVTNNVETFSILMKEQRQQQQKQNTVGANTNPLPSLLKSLRK